VVVGPVFEAAFVVVEIEVEDGGLHVELPEVRGGAVVESARLKEQV
jgi:hypothetical protein